MVEHTLSKRAVMGSIALMTDMLPYMLYSIEKYTIIVGCPPHQEGARTHVAVVINCVRCCVTNISAPLRTAAKHEAT